GLYHRQSPEISTDGTEMTLTDAIQLADTAQRFGRGVRGRPHVHVRLQHPAEPRKMRLRMCNAGVIEILSQSSGVHLIRGQFGYRKLLYVKVIF
ncbi:hypothetical protein BZY52_26745, partial [Enterobacter hormaechei]